MANDNNRRLGRPPLPPGQIRNRRVVTFVTNSEFDQLKRLSAELNTPLSTTIHQLLSACLSNDGTHHS